MPIIELKLIQPNFKALNCYFKSYIFITKYSCKENLTTCDYYIYKHKYYLLCKGHMILLPFKGFNQMKANVKSNIQIS